MQSDWLDVNWFSLLAEEIGVNITVWKPAEDGDNVQLYAALGGGAVGLFLHDKRERMDEEGDFWLHLIYHPGEKPFEARDEVKPGFDRHVMHNHFDFLQLGASPATASERKNFCQYESSWEVWRHRSRPSRVGEKQRKGKVAGGEVPQPEQTL